MRVLFVTSEVATLFKLGGLGDVSYALPVGLRRLRINVSVALPYYAKIKANARCLGPIAVDFDSKRELVFVFVATLQEGRVPVYLFRHPFLNDYHRAPLATTFAFFCQVVSHFYLYAQALVGHSFDIVHCHDWHTALVPLILGESNKANLREETLEASRTKTILTIHNLLYPGETGESIIKKLGLAPSRFHLFNNPLGRAVKLLREGLEHADVITTVSPTYAKEIARHPSDIGVLLRARKDRMVGILNGIDQALWDPATDPNLPIRYNRRTVAAAKRRIKAHLQHALRLPKRNLPLFGFVGRLEVRQKGIDILAHATEKLTADSFQLVILGTGEKKQVKIVTKLAAANHHLVYINTFDERLARRIYAGADVMLVPSKFEPCGLTQMIAMRYGTIPLVRKTGGLADTVTHRKTGFVFRPYTGRALAAAMKAAIAVWRKPKQWQQMIQNVMRQDFSWRKSARAYLKLYSRILA